MPYGPRYGRMAEPESADEAAARRRKERKLELCADVIKEFQLSWRIKTRYGEDDWAVLTYDLQWREGMPGALIMVDRDTDMDVKIYAPGMWFSLDTVAYIEGEWVIWKPQAAYLADLADRLIEEEMNK